MVDFELVMLGTFMAVMDVTVVNVGLPTIMSVFHIPISTAEWVITAYMITMTLMLPSAGWIADRIGNKRMYILGLVLFTFGSWLCGRAGSDMFLISARALQGFGSGIIHRSAWRSLPGSFLRNSGGWPWGCGRWRPPLRSRSVL